MVPHHLIHESHHAMVDAMHRSVLLPLDSIQRISHWAIGSGREFLSSEMLRDPRVLSDMPTSTLGTVGRRSLDGYRYCLEVGVDAYAKWLDLCEEQWHLAHQRLDSTIDHYRKHVPIEASLALFAVEKATDLAEVTADAVAEGSKSAAVEALNEIVSTYPDADQTARSGSGKRALKPKSRRVAA